MTHWRVFKLQNGLGKHAQEWDTLNQRKFKNHPMLDSRFVNGLLLHFGGEGERLCVMEKAGRTEAMCLLRHDQFSRWTTFLPSQAQIGPALVDSLTELQQLMRDLPGLVARLDMLCSDSAFGDVATDPKNTTYTSNHALTINIALRGSFEDYWRARPKKLVQNLSRYERRLAAEGIQTDFRCLSGFAATGQAMVYELWFGGQLAASRPVITSNEMALRVKTTYAEAFARFSAGGRLLQRVVEHLFSQRPGSMIEFYTNASVDQLAWATGRRDIRHISFYTDSLTAGFFELMRKSRNRFFSRLRLQ